MSAAEGASEASSLEQANEWAVRANERTDERVAQYYSLYSWLFSTIVHMQFFLYWIIKPQYSNTKFNLRSITDSRDHWFEHIFTGHSIWNFFKYFEVTTSLKISNLQGKKYLYRCLRGTHAHINTTHIPLPNLHINSHTLTDVTIVYNQSIVGLKGAALTMKTCHRSCCWLRWGRFKFADDELTQFRIVAFRVISTEREKPTAKICGQGQGLKVNSTLCQIVLTNLFVWTAYFFHSAVHHGR